MGPDEQKQIHHYWDYGLDRHDYFDSHSIEWLRNTANQLALVNSLGATVSVALAAGMQAAVFLLPGAAFFVGALLVLLAAFLAYRGNAKYAREMKDRLQLLSEKNRAQNPGTLDYAKVTIRSEATAGNSDHVLAAKLAWGSLMCIAIGALFLLPTVLCQVK